MKAEERFPMVARFHYGRWSASRTALHDMRVGTTREFPRSEKWNVVTSIRRLQDAYEGTRKYSYKMGGEKVVVTRTK